VNEARSIHTPVLKEELIDVLDLEQSNTVIDATVGLGGHARAVLQRLGDGRLIGLERDPQIFERVKRSFRSENRVDIVHDNYRNLERVAQERSLSSVQAVYFDLGVNSFHYEKSRKGFSFRRKNDPLDMRFNPGESVPTAKAGMKLPNVRTFARVHGWRVDIDTDYQDGVRLLVRDVSIEPSADEAQLEDGAPQSSDGVEPKPDGETRPSTNGTTPPEPDAEEQSADDPQAPAGSDEAEQTE